MVTTAQWLKVRVPKKKFFLPIESWVFIIFLFLFLLIILHEYHLQCNLFNLNVKSLIAFKKFYKFHGVGVLSQDPC
jgi:hypothetical protein